MVERHRTAFVHPSRVTNDLPRRYLPRHNAVQPRAQLKRSISQHQSIFHTEAAMQRQFSGGSTMFALIKA